MPKALQPASPISKNPKDWKAIPGYEGRYECDRYGRVRSTVGKAPRLITQFKRRGNACSRGKAVFVKLTDANGKSREKLVGRLIYSAWVGPVKHYIYHKNGMLWDNAVENLTDIPRAEIARLAGYKGASRSVVRLDAEGNGEFYKSAREAGRKNYLSYQTVSDRCNHRIIKDEYIGGYTYRWADELR